MEQKKKKIYIEKNYYMLCVHAVFMGMTTDSCNGGGGEASLPSDGVWETRNDSSTSHDAGMIDTADVACMSDIWHACSTSAPFEQQVYDKLK